MLPNMEPNADKRNQTKLRPWERLIVKSCLSLTALNILSWVYILLVSKDWLKKRTPYYSLDGTLLNIKVSHGVYSKVIGAGMESLTGGEENALSKLFLARKTFHLEEFREFVCALPKYPSMADLCDVWTGVQHASWMLLFCGVVGCILLSVAGGLLYYYAFNRARAKTRNFIKLFYVLAPLVQLAGVVGYMIATVRVSEMVPKVSGGGAVFGSSVLYALSATMFSFIPLIMMNSMLGKILEESRNEARSALKKFKREEGELYGSNLYGATGNSAAGVAQGKPDAGGAGQEMLQQAFAPQHQQQDAYYQPAPEMSASSSSFTSDGTSSSSSSFTSDTTSSSSTSS